jgi:hypothetical protein
MENLAAALRHPVVEIVARYRHRQDVKSFRSDVEAAILETISRRPCTMDDLSSILDLHPLELTKYLDVLETERRVRLEAGERGVFYRAVSPESR